MAALLPLVAAVLPSAVLAALLCGCTATAPSAAAKLVMCTARLLRDVGCAHEQCNECA
jgi:hypothetical protein